MLAKKKSKQNKNKKNKNKTQGNHTKPSDSKSFLFSPLLTPCLKLSLVLSRGSAFHSVSVREHFLTTPPKMSSTAGCNP